MKSLPQTGTAAHLETLSPYLDDDVINDPFPRRKGRGRRRLFSAAQLFRVLFLNLVTPVHSFNLLVKLLAENRSWRSFARLRNQRNINMAMQTRLRQQMQVGILTNLPANYDLPKNVEPALAMRCVQGQKTAMARPA